MESFKTHAVVLVLCHKLALHTVLTGIQSPVKWHGWIQMCGKMAPINLSCGAAPMMGIKRTVAYYRVHTRYWRLRWYAFPLGRGQCRFSFMIGRLARRNRNWKKKEPTPQKSLRKLAKYDMYPFLNHSNANYSHIIFCFSLSTKHLTFNLVKYANVKN